MIGHRTTPKNAAPWKINFSQLSFRGAACSVAPAMINSEVYLFLTRSAARRGVRWGRNYCFFSARRGAARRGVWWGRSLRRSYVHPTTREFLGAFVEFLDMSKASQQTRGIHPMLFRCGDSSETVDQHWNNIGWMPRFCWVATDLRTGYELLPWEARKKWSQFCSHGVRTCHCDPGLSSLEGSTKFVCWFVTKWCNNTGVNHNP